MSIEKIKELGEIDILCLLYLLHRPSHGYEIAKSFNKAKEEGSWTPKERGFGALKEPNKIYRVLNKLQSMGLIQEVRSDIGVEKKKIGKPLEDKTRRNVYALCPEFFREYDLPKIRRLVNCNNVRKCFYVLSRISPDDTMKIIKHIGHYNKYDVLTFTRHLKKQLSDVEYYLELNIELRSRNKTSTPTMTNKELREYIRKVLEPICSSYKVTLKYVVDKKVAHKETEIMENFNFLNFKAIWHLNESELKMFGYQNVSLYDAIKSVMRFLDAFEDKFIELERFPQEVCEDPEIIAKVREILDG